MENTLQLGNLLKEGTYPEEYTGGEKWTILHGDTLKLVKASSNEESEKGCRMYDPGTSEYDIQFVQYEAVERKQEKTFEIEIRKSYTIRKSISAHSREEAVERAEILYKDGGFDGEFDERTMDVNFEVITEKAKKKEQVG